MRVWAGWTCSCPTLRISRYARASFALWAGYAVRQTTATNQGGCYRACSSTVTHRGSEYAVCTIYQEQLPKLPSEVNWEEAQSVGNAAIPVDKARNRWHACDFTIMMAPRIGQDGEPEKTTNGRVRYRFVDVLDADGNAPPQLEAPAQAQERPQAAQNQQYAPQPQQRTQPALAPTPQQRHQPAQAEDYADGLLTPYTTAFDEMEESLEDEVKGFVRRMRQLDRASTEVLGTDMVKPDGKRQVGQYEFLAGTIDSLGKSMTGYGGMHKQVLSFILGRPISKNARPGDRLRVMFEEIWEGNANRPNPNLLQASRDTMAVIHYLVRNIYDEVEGEVAF